MTRPLLAHCRGTAQHGPGLIVDLFAGGGGASTGIALALGGRDPDIAINHDQVAVHTHRSNHPGTVHYCQDVWQVSPRWATRGRRVSLLWASPDCTHHSKAKGGPPKRDAKRRDLAWVVTKWAREVRPECIILENVEEFKNWGPVDNSGVPIKSQAGASFRSFVQTFRRLGYSVQWRELRACDYGAPTIRKRLFLIARCDGQPIVWPEPTHGPGRLPYRTAAECIDWSIPCPSIFERSKPLAENTLRRIAAGIKRYVIEAAEPYIVTYYGPKKPGEFRGCGMDGQFGTQTTENRHALVTPYMVKANHGYPAFRGNDLREPLRTVTASEPGFALVAPTLIQTGYGEREGQAPRALDLGKPLGTVVGTPKHAMVGALLKHYGGVVGQELARPIGTVTTVDHHSVVAEHLQRDFGNSIGQDAAAPCGTITAGGGGKTGLVTSHLVKLRGTCRHGQPTDAPAPTITSGGTHVGEVRAFLTKYYGQGIGCPLDDPAATVTSKDRMGLVTVQIEGHPYFIADIGMRMLQPHELAAAQGFPSTYRMDTGPDGKALSKAAKVRLIGNSVCPPIASALVRANSTPSAKEAAR